MSFDQADSPEGAELAEAYLDASDGPNTPSTQIATCRPPVALGDEKWHKTAIRLAARSRLDAHAIADVLEISVPEVRELFMLPDVQEAIFAEAGDRVPLFDLILEGEHAQSLATLIQLRDESPKDDVRYRAATKLLEIFAEVKGGLSDGKNVDSGPESVERMQKQLAELDQKLKDRFGASGHKETKNGTN